jgi:hypothetical protein
MGTDHVRGNREERRAYVSFRGKRAMSDPIPLFQFRLRNGMSIGPVALRRIWSTASQSQHVTVSRELRRLGNQQSGHVYSLNGPPNLCDLSTIEIRLRNLLNDVLPEVHVVLIRLL